MLYEPTEKMVFMEAGWEETLDEPEIDDFQELEPEGQPSIEQFENVGQSAESGLDVVIKHLGGTPEDWQYESFSGPETYFRNNEIVYADNQSLTREIIEGGDEAAIVQHEEMLEALGSGQPFVFDGILEGVHYGSVVRLDGESQLQYENFSHRMEKEKLDEDDLLNGELSLDFFSEQAFAVSTVLTESPPNFAEAGPEPSVVSLSETSGAGEESAASNGEVESFTNIEFEREAQNKPETEIKEVDEGDQREVEESPIEIFHSELVAVPPETDIVRLPKPERQSSFAAAPTPNIFFVPSTPITAPDNKIKPVKNTQEIFERAAVPTPSEIIKPQEELAWREDEGRTELVVEPAEISEEIMAEPQEVREPGETEVSDFLTIDIDSERPEIEEFSSRTTDERDLAKSITSRVEMRAETRAAERVQSIVREKSVISRDELRRSVSAAEEKIISVKQREVLQEFIQESKEGAASRSTPEHIEKKIADAIKIPEQKIKQSFPLKDEPFIKPKRVREKQIREEPAQSFETEERELMRSVKSVRTKKKADIILRFLGVPQHRLATETLHSGPRGFITPASVATVTDDTEPAQIKGEEKSELDGIILIRSRL